MTPKGLGQHNKGTKMADGTGMEAKPDRTKYFNKLIALSLTGTLLGGCATLRGSQDGVGQLVPQNLVVMDTALNNYNQPAETNALRSGMTRRGYRDYVLTSYLIAIENKYKRFVDQLQGGDRGSALGFDLLQLGLNGATALAGVSVIEELATVSAVTAGARASIDKRLFYDRTMPAIIASMDAERASIKASIAQKRKLPADVYSLNDASDDLSRLIQAGRLDRAVARMTETARNDQRAEQQRLDMITAACAEVTDKTSELNAEFRIKIHGNPQRVKQASDALEVTAPVGGDPAALDSAVRLAFVSKTCSDAEKRAIIDGIN
jgi:hypothetical protein